MPGVTVAATKLSACIAFCAFDWDGCEMDDALSLVHDMPMIAVIASRQKKVKKFCFIDDYFNTQILNLK